MPGHPPSDIVILPADLPDAAPRPWLRRPDPGQVLRHGVQVALANTAIAAVIVTLHGGRFGATLVYAQAIGALIWLVIEFGRLTLPRAPFDGWPQGRRGMALVLAACAVGYLGGTAIADALLGFSSWNVVVRPWAAAWRDITLTAVFCTIVAGWFYLRSRVTLHRARAAAADHAATLARLSALQSQLEPHMLFNTLANLHALIAADPPRAQQMLDQLIAFLRATLAASRAPAHPLADEFARIDDYLALMRVRMGERLHAATALPPELAALAVPPLLLQPLVENAIKHGLEPQRGAGELRVTATLDATTLVLAVVDSGRGLAAAAAAAATAPALEPTRSGGGFGLAQVRERLHALHGDAARFTLETRPEGGTRAEIRLPVTVSTPAAKSCA